MTELTDDQLRQLEFEQTCKLKAKQKFRRDVRKMRYEMEGGYASGTPAGRSMSNSLLGFIAPHVQQLLDDVPQRKYVPKPTADAWLLCSLMGVEKVVGITIKTLIDIVGREKGALKATPVVNKIGTRLLCEYVRTQWEKSYPAEFANLESKYKHAGVWHKLHGMSAIFGKHYDLDASTLKAELGGNALTSSAGAFILEPILNLTDWFRKDTRSVSPTRRQTFLVPTEAFDLWFSQYHEQVEQQLLIAYPMVSEPRDWDDNGLNGGYLDPVDKYRHLLKDGKGQGSSLSPKQLEFINKTLQPVKWELNPFVVEVQEALFRTPGGAVDSFRPISFHPLTNEPMPDHISALPMDHPARVEWRREKALINATNADSRRKGVRTVRNVSASRLLKDEVFYCPWAVGHNGRCYPLSQGALSPQGADAEKALLRFHKGAPITPDGERWLALHLANCYGITESHALKMQWIEDNKQLITDLALNPLDYIEIWEGADEPWQFIAACDEYYHCVIAKDRLETKLPISCDATASGLQILALLGRDVDCAEQVNLLPHTTSKMDIYGKLKEVTKVLLREQGRADLVKLYIPRKAYKAALVSRIYGSHIRSRNKALTKHLFEAHNHQLDLIDSEDLMLISRTIEKAMWVVAPKALELFEQLRRIGAHCAKAGEPARWITPLGNQVVVRPTQHGTKRVDLGWLGHLRVADDTKGEKLLTSKVRSSFAPLLIHSLDACVLTEAFHDWRLPISTTHDCFCTRATDMTDALKKILTAYKTVLFNGKAFIADVGAMNGLEVDIDQGAFTDEMFDDLPNLEYAFC